MNKTDWLSHAQFFIELGRAGLEPAQPCGQRILSPSRLPIPPPAHTKSQNQTSVSTYLYYFIFFRWFVPENNMLWDLINNKNLKTPWVKFKHSPESEIWFANFLLGCGQGKTPWLNTVYLFGSSIENDAFWYYFKSWQVHLHARPGSLSTAPFPISPSSMPKSGSEGPCLANTPTTPSLWYLLLEVWLLPQFFI